MKTQADIIRERFHNPATRQMALANWKARLAEKTTLISCAWCKQDAWVSHKGCRYCGPRCRNKQAAYLLAIRREERRKQA
jgi:hypothetical protein